MPVSTTDYNEDVAWLREQVERDGIRYLLAMFVDMHGKPCAKMMPLPALDLLLNEGAGFAGFAVGHMGQNPSDPDLLAKPDPRSYMRLPWKPEVAVLHSPRAGGALALCAEGHPAEPAGGDGPARLDPEDRCGG